MASLTIRNLPEDVKQSLRVQAAQAGLSMEAYARNLLQSASGVPATQEATPAAPENTAETDDKPIKNIYEISRKYFGNGKGVESDFVYTSAGREIRFKL